MACQLEEVDFTESDLSQASFFNSDLNQAQFHQTILTKANFLGAKNVSIDPEENYLTKATFSQDQLAGLLGKYQLNIK